jgi:hypothetical protein
MEKSKRPQPNQTESEKSNPLKKNNKKNKGKK